MTVDKSTPIPEGISISFACEDDSFHIPDIEKFLGKKLECDYPDDKWLIKPVKPEKKPESNDEKEKTVTKEIQKSGSNNRYKGQTRNYKKSGNRAKKNNFHRRAAQPKPQKIRTPETTIKKE